MSNSGSSRVTFGRSPLQRPVGEVASPNPNADTAASGFDRPYRRQLPLGTRCLTVVVFTGLLQTEEALAAIALWAHSAEAEDDHPDAVGDERAANQPGWCTCFHLHRYGR